MVRPCVASGFAELAVSGLASMYPAFDWSICSGPSWISARVRSDWRTGLDWTIWVTSVRTRSEDRTSISSHPLADLGWKLLIGLRHRLLLISRSSFVRTRGRSFVPARRTSIATRAWAVKAGRRAWLAAFEPKAVPSPRPAERRSRRAQGRSRPAVALGLRQALALPGRALTAPSTARGSRGLDDVCIVGPRQLEGASFSQHRPGDAGKLVGERDRQHVVVQPPLGGFDPRFEPVTFPVLYPDQHNPCRLHKQNAQVAIAAPGDLADDRAVSRLDLLVHQSEPGAEVAAFGEYVSSADRGHHGARNDRPDARHRHQPRPCLILTGQCFDLAG